MARKHRKRSKPAPRTVAPAGRPPRGPAAAPKKSDGATTRARTQPARAGHPLDPWLLGLAALGVLLTAYLTGVAWFGDHPAYCQAGSDCDIVQSSRWSTLLGLPISLWGLLTYALLARGLWRLRSKPSAWRFTLFLASIGTGVSWFLNIVSVVRIEATCLYCLASFVLMNVLFVLVLLRRPAQMPEHAWRTALPPPIGAALVVVLGLQLHFSGLFDPASGPEDPYLKGLAIHLEESGARFYGAYWCPRCMEQKELFTASVDRLPYIECSPEGRGGLRNLECVTQDIQEYPTWLIDDQRYPGLMSVRQLAAISGFRWDEEAQSPVSTQ